MNLMKTGHFHQIHGKNSSQITKKYSIFCPFSQENVKIPYSYHVQLVNSSGLAVTADTVFMTVE